MERCQVVVQVRHGCKQGVAVVVGTVQLTSELSVFVSASPTKFGFLFLCAG
jgi:hypothetical protein